MREIAPLVSALDGLIAQLSPEKRRALAREIGRNLAQSQRTRIAQQQNPDGSAFEMRKVQKPRKGKIRQKAMFRKLRTARFMRTVVSAEGVSVGYSGQNAFIASRHQFGLEGVVNKKRNLRHQYAQRELLGFSADDLRQIEAQVMAHFSQ